MEFSSQKKIAAIISILSNSFLILLKIICGVLSGSISIISEALHSLCDLLASFIAFISIKKSSEPADFDHPFGHGKFEDLAGFVEAILIIFTALYIFYIAMDKIIFNKASEIQPVLGIWIMAFSVVLNFLVSRYLYRIAKKSDSIALYTDAQHLSADIYSSLAVLLGLIFIQFTGYHIFDPVFAIIVAMLIFRTGVKLTKKSMDNLVDTSLPKEENDLICNIISDKNPKIIVTSLKTSKSGVDKNIQLEIQFEPDITLRAAHDICNSIEHEITLKIRHAKVIIHMEPYKIHHSV